MIARVVVLTALLSACIRSASVECDRESVCPEGTTCARIAGTDDFACIGANPRCGNGRLELFQLDDGQAIPNEQCDEADTRGFDGCSPGCQIETPRWTELEFGRPGRTTGVSSHAMAFDIARRRLVVFGGNGSNETWESDGVGWARIATTVGPSARSGHAMAYDAARHRIVLFGGSGAGDTWTWDGQTWQLVEPPESPEGRDNHAMAYDARREVVVMFGGASGLDDTWEWNGETWSRSAVVSPGARRFHAMAYDSRRATIVLAGGTSDQAGVLGDSWTFDGATWQMSGPLPEPKRRFALAYDPASSRMIAFGGDDGPSALPGATWAWDGVTWVVLPVVNPPGRTAGAVATDPIAQRIVLLGGEITSSVDRLDDVWTWDGASWAEIPRSPTPGPLAYAASAYDTRRGTLVVFGGTDDVGVLQGRTLELSGTTWRVISTAVAPPATRSASMVFDEARGRALLFGGATALQVSGETWSWDGATWTLEAGGPPPREAGAMAYDPLRERVVLFGGHEDNVLGDTWEWDGIQWEQRGVGDPGLVRTQHTLAFDHRIGRVILFGGDMIGGGNILSDLEVLAWDAIAGAWSIVGRAPTLASKAYQGAAWDGDRGALMVFGGGALTFAMTASLDVCEWTTECRDITPGGPLARLGHLMNTTRDGVVMFGGADGTGDFTATFADAWRLRYASVSSYEMCASDVDNDGDGLAGCDDPDCWATCTPACAPGLCTAAIKCGDGTCNAALENCRNCPGDCTCAPVCGDAICDALEDCPGDC